MEKKNWEKINKFTRNEFVSNIKSENDFNEFVVRSPRNYTLLILFNSERECYACREVDKIYDSVSRMYESQKNVTADGTELFFLRLPVESAYSIGVKVLSSKFNIPQNYFPIFFHQGFYRFYKNMKNTLLIFIYGFFC